jgi:iron complex transport system permease protein
VTALAAARQTSRTRSVRVVTVLSVLVVLVAGVSLAVGPFTLSLPDLVATLLGQGSGGDEFVIFRLRMPRLVLGAMVGAAFGLAGALFQNLLRNPLASPDLIGISGGASVAAAFGILVLGVSGAMLPLVAFGGAVVIAAGIYLLAWKQGISGYRFVLIGVGFAFMAQAVLGFLITRGDVREVQQALVWMVGGVGGAQWGDIIVLAIALLVLLPLVAALARPLSALQLGDDSAGGLGIAVERTKLTALVVGVALAAVGAAFAGPIAFVAFVSAPIAHRLLGTGSLGLVPSALVGVLVVTVSDFIAQHLLPGGLQVPVGIITGLVGAPYLLWLLARAGKGGQAA